MAEFGQVVQILDGEVKVRLNRQEACAKCGACTAGLESKDMFIEATNIAKAKVDEWVEIQLEEANFIRAVAIMYGIPLVGLLGGLFLGTLIGNIFMPDFTELVGIILGLAGAGVCFWLIHLNEAKFKTKRFKPKAVRVVDFSETCEL